MTRSGRRIVAALATLLAVVLVIASPIGPWLWAHWATVLSGLVILVGGLWVANAAGLTTLDKVAITNTAADALLVTGGIQSINAPLARRGSNEIITGSWNFQSGGPQTFLAEPSFAQAIVVRGRASDSLGDVRWHDNSLATTFGSIGITPGGGLTYSAINNGHTFAGGRINSNTAQPGFLAFRTANIAGVTSPLTIVFNSEVYDGASNYDPANGVFTAPVAGRYLFTAVVAATCGGVSGSTSNVRLVTSNRTYQVGRVAFGVSEQSSLGGCVIADMDAGDTASVLFSGFASSGQVDGDPSTLVTYFSGRLMA